MNDSKAVPAAGMHRAKTWEIGFYALNNTSTNTYMMCDGSDHRVHGRQDERQAGEEPSFHHHRKFDLDGVLVHYVFCGPAAAGEFCAPPAVFHCSVCNLYHRLHLPVCCHQIGAVLHDERSKAAADICHL